MNRFRKWLKRWIQSRRASIALVTTLITLGIIIVLGLLVTANFYTAASAMDLGTAGNATRTTLFSNIWVAFDLAAIIPIVAGAGSVLGVVLWYFRGRGV
jgi:hypothetical protein